MVFKHRVKLNGIYYNAGEEVPVEETKVPANLSDTKAEPKVLTKKELLAIAEGLGLEVHNKMTNAVLEEMIKEAQSEGTEKSDSGVKETILTSENSVNEDVNLPADGNEEETGNEDNEDSSFLDEVIKGNE